jgi:hypothetical protein
MFAIDPVAGAVAIAILAAVYQYLRVAAVPERRRDSRRAYRFRQVREGLRDLASHEEKPGEWQPQILVFTASEERRARVLRFSSWISGGTGMVTAVQLIEGSSERARAACAEAEQALRAEIEEQALDAYALVVSSPDLRPGFSSIVQSWGAGAIRSNVVVVNWQSGTDAASSAALWYARTLGQALRLRRSVVVLAAEEAAWQRMQEIPNEKRRIDVWWFDDESSRLALLLAYLMTRDDGWDEATIRVLISAAPDQEEHARAGLERRLEESRIVALAESVADPDAEAVVSRCRDAALVFLPLRLPGMRLVDPFGFGLDGLLKGLPVVALVAGAEDVQIAEEEPESEAAPPAPEDGAPPQADA